MLRARAWVEQAKDSLEADNIALREYECGVLPQDVELVRQNIAICRIEKEQAARNLAWARRALAKGFRTEGQVTADAAALEQTEIALRDAEGMLERLVKYTGRRIIKSRKARIQAIQADLLSLEASFRLERERLETNRNHDRQLHLAGATRLASSFMPTRLMARGHPTHKFMRD